MSKVTGHGTGVNGNLVSVGFDGSISKNEVGYILLGDTRLKGEVIRINGDTASMQIYEMTNGIKVGDPVEFTGELLSVKLGPASLPRSSTDSRTRFRSSLRNAASSSSAASISTPYPTRNGSSLPASNRANTYPRAIP